MTEEMYNKWLAALRSGEYDHGIGRLRRTHEGPNPQKDTFCCLGVLCDVMDTGEWEPSLEHPLGIRYTIDLGDGANPYAMEISILNQVMKEWFSGKTNYDRDTTQNDLINLNDSDTSFEKVIAYIEEHPEKFIHD